MPAGAAAIADDEFEALLDTLHGKGVQPGAEVPFAPATVSMDPANIAH